MTHVRALTYVFFVRAQRKACQVKGLPLDTWRNVLESRRPCIAPGTATLIRQLGVRAVLGVPPSAFWRGSHM